MPLFYQHNINESTKLGIWKIEEPEDFFLARVPLQRTITHPHKRLQHLAGRWLLKTMFPDFPYTEIVIADTKKPYLPYEQYHFSISHCGNYAAAIVSKDHRVGIDIEIPTERMLKIKNKFLSVKELELLPAEDAINIQSMPAIQSLTVLWGAKEAIFKWWGWGSVDFKENMQLRSFEINADAGLIHAAFVNPAETFPLVLEYKLFDELCLVWLLSAR